MDSLEQVCTEYGMEVNVKKTEVMVISNEDDVQRGQWSLT